MHAYRDQYATLFDGGRGVVLIGISTDSPKELHAWARDDEFPFLMASDSASVAASRFGLALRPSDVIQTRTVAIIDPDGKIAWWSSPFREIDPTAYTELAEALDRIIVPPEDDEEG